MAMFGIEKWWSIGKMGRIISLLLLIFSGSYLLKSLSIPYGRISEPGPGIFPVGVGILMTLLTFFNFIKFFHGVPSKKTGESLPQGKDFYRWIGILLVLVFYGVFLGVLGYILSSIILLMLVLFLLGMNGWIRIVLISILTSVISYYLFSIILDVPLPRGILFS